jgi:hypothetical protein
VSLSLAVIGCILVLAVGASLIRAWRLRSQGPVTLRN